MNEVHLTNVSIPGVRCLREMKASTNKIRRDTIYTSKMIVERGIMKTSTRSLTADCITIPNRDRKKDVGLE